MKERDHFGDTGIDRKIILKKIRVYRCGLHSTAHDRVQWTTLVNMVLIFRFHYTMGNFLTI
jgi:hypothetical protein